MGVLFPCKEGRHIVKNSGHLIKRVLKILTGFRLVLGNWEEGSRKQGFSLDAIRRWS